MKEKIKIAAFSLALLLIQANIVFAEATTKEDIASFLEQVGDFLIMIVGPGILVIGVAIAGVSMALGNEYGMKQGAVAAAGGALIMLSRAILDLIMSVTGF